MKKPQHGSSADESLTVGEAAEFLGVSSWTLRNWDRVGRLRPARHPENGYRIYRKDDLKAVLAEQALLKTRKENFATRFEWEPSDGTRHFIQFYESAGYLAEASSWFVETGLKNDQAVVLFAHPEHASRVERKLRARGVNLNSVIDQGRYLSFPAAETLEKLLVAGAPDRDRFMEGTGSKIRELRARWGGVRIIGQMVTLLWEQGAHDSAARLEEYWNELSKLVPFAFLWSYSLASFSDALDGASSMEICRRRAFFFEDAGGDGFAGQRPTAGGSPAGFAGDHQRPVGAVSSAVAVDLVENGNEPMHRLGPDGQIIWANAAELDLLGYAAGEYIGHHIGEFHASQGAMREILERLQGGEELNDYPCRLRCKDGSVKPVLLSANAHILDGQFLFARCFSRDAEERVRTEEAARASERRFSRFMQFLPGLAWIKDLEGRYLFANDAALRAFGVSRSELYGRTDSMLFDAETAAQFRENDRKALESDGGLQTVEIFRRKDGTVHHSIVSKFVITGNDGKADLIGGMAIDLSDSLGLPNVQQVLREIGRQET